MVALPNSEQWPVTFPIPQLRQAWKPEILLIKVFKQIEGHPHS